MLFSFLEEQTMLEAMWAVTFASNVRVGPAPDANMGGGIVVLETGRVLGGDLGMTYVGDTKLPLTANRSPQKSESGDIEISLAINQCSARWISSSLNFMALQLVR